MPQTSPINWLILTLFTIMSIMYTISYSNEKICNSKTMKSNFNSTILSWKW